MGKGEIDCYEEFLLFPVFSKDLYCRHVKKKTGLVWERVNHRAMQPQVNIHTHIEFNKLSVEIVNDFEKFHFITGKRNRRNTSAGALKYC